MSEIKKTFIRYFLIAMAVIAIDQIVKMLVFFYMDKGSAGQIHLLGDFFKLHYLTNPGMAFGLQFGSDNGKFVLTILRLFAMVGITYYLFWLVKKNSPSGLLWCMALILGGAIGNVIDSTFYGVWFDNAPYDAPTPWFHGQVIDMFYIDIWEGRLPDWLPLFGNEHVALWPVFNVADASIFIGISIILVYQKKFFKTVEEETSTNVTPQSQEVNSEI